MNKRTFLLDALCLAVTATTCAQNTYPWPASGNVGIGTTTPGAPLEIKTALGGAGYPNLRLRAGPYGYWDLTSAYSSTNPDLFFSSNGVQNVTFQATGNVGIGTPAPGYKLDIAVPASGESTSLKLSGRATGGIQMRVGDDYAGAFGTRYSGADTFVSSNAFQSALNTDSWTKGVSTYGSTIAVLGINPTLTSPAFQVKYSPANTVSGVMSSFFSSDLLTILGSGNVGIGTSLPSSKLHVNGSSCYGQLTLSTSSATPVVGGFGISGANNQIVTGENLGDLSIWTGQAINFSANNGQTLQIKLTSSGNVGIGTSNPAEKLSVKGRIRAQEVVVDNNNWSDYVLADDYKLQSLTDVETQIKTNKHLPGVPSAQEVAEKGVSVGDMQAVLLAKIEELTLHQIELEKRVNAQQAEIVRLKAATP